MAAAADRLALALQRTLTTDTSRCTGTGQRPTHAIHLRANLMGEVNFTEPLTRALKMVISRYVICSTLTSTENFNGTGTHTASHRLELVRAKSLEFRLSQMIDSVHAAPWGHLLG
jgi:hypothetical protein